MAITNILYGLKYAQIEDIEVDAEVQTDHDSSLQLTRHVIENGGKISDNKMMNPRRITMLCRISNTPTYDIGLGVLDLQRANDAWVALQNLQRRDEPITVVTSLETLSNMVIVDLKAVRRHRTGQVLDFTMTVEEVTFVFSETVAVAEASLRKPDPSPKKQAPKAASHQQKTSMLQHLAR